MRRFPVILISLALLLPLERARAQAGSETLDQALCRMIERSALAHRLPTDFLTRLIWRESSFRPHVVSPAGAQGVAQFMPGTATERRLANPFDPEQAIPEAARLLSELQDQFGNLGLAAAAYNGGPARVRNWLDGRGGLPLETREYVLAITSRSAEDWAEVKKTGGGTALAQDAPASTCLQLALLLRGPLRDAGGGGAPLAPWGVQLAGNFSKQRALASFARASRSYLSLLADARPMIIGTRLRSRGTRAFYRVRVPAPTRAAADALCSRIRSAGGSCLVMPS